MTGPVDDPVGQLSDLLDQLTGTPPAAAGDAEPAGETIELVYANVAQFVDDYLIHVVERRLATGAAAGLFWCPRWWAHPEALSRIYTLWRAWESLRVSDPALGMSVWWRDHLDPHLNALTAEYGPFGRCQPAADGRPARHHEPQPLPVEPVPDDVLRQLPEGRQAILP